MNQDETNKETRAAFAQARVGKAGNETGWRRQIPVQAVEPEVIEESYEDNLTTTVVLLDQVKS